MLVLGLFLIGPILVCTMIPGNQQNSSIWKVGKEGGKCNFLLFDAKWVASLKMIYVDLFSDQASIQLENKGDLSYFFKQDEVRCIYQ